MSQIICYLAEMMDDEDLIDLEYIKMNQSIKLIVRYTHQQEDRQVL